MESSELSGGDWQMFGSPLHSDTTDFEALEGRILPLLLRIRLWLDQIEDGIEDGEACRGCFGVQGWGEGRDPDGQRGAGAVPMCFKPCLAPFKTFGGCFWLGFRLGWRRLGGTVMPG